MTRAPVVPTLATLPEENQSVSGLVGSDLRNSG